MGGFYCEGFIVNEMRLKKIWYDISPNPNQVVLVPQLIRPLAKETQSCNMK